MTNAEDADNAVRGIVLVYHSVVADSNSVDMLRADESSTPYGSRVVCQATCCGDDTRYLLAVYAAQVMLSRALPFNSAGGHWPSASS